MAKVSGVVLQGVNYHWDGQDILVDDGVGMPWPLNGSLLDQVELFDEEGEPMATFSIDFLAQQWSLVGENQPQDVTLLDDNGCLLPLSEQGETSQGSQMLVSVFLPPIGLTPPAQEGETKEALSLTDILQDADRLLEVPPATSTDIANLSSESINDVISWLAVYHHH